MVSDLGSGAMRTLVAGASISAINDVTPQNQQFRANAQGVLYLDVTVSSSGTGAANTISLGAPVGIVAAPAAPTGIRIVR
jgi:hypothetical protein